MGVPYQPLEGHELKLRREALEAERKSRYMPHLDIPEVPVENGKHREDMVQTGPHSPGIVMPGPAKESTVLQVSLMENSMENFDTKM